MSVNLLSASKSEVTELEASQRSSEVVFEEYSYTPEIIDVPAEQKNSQQVLADKKLPVSVFGSTFLTIFLAELGDKTQVTTLLMSAESHAPWMVFAGAGTALVATSLIGVLLGQWLAKWVSPKTLETGAGITMLIISALVFVDVLS
ncbi:TMEM165/GDT1 family protein [Ancylothrix sp. C2]|uniref:TMEM165/GDT1 family protein n=1 Tax=Ancylothrix sp. D3o TaxID=2953691 RepID=UPI0021BB7206|nr:TMEM165/GDT1 family protein [Ancylothrix sp. D3o]MCT7952617.1 TMEM165/GDT1 family protein [Ancylothrix sp. D3o]